ncbi:L-2-hydroxyglutarate oxidase [Pontibacter sp. JAM-7]|uniref:L-2-hydroxyglutarate oxidase n=1 Tax=Pontibacter sp. JAM-7 TaxID=3366581 RepID=UPI003AF62551
MNTHKALYDFLIVGGGILGLATAWQLQQRYPDRSVLLLEKEAALASHQTGRNSGVIHAGVYYAPGSLKARFCKQGNAETKAFCREHQIPFDECGKLLVATTADELQRMQVLQQRCHDNDIAIEVLDQQGLAAREPNVTGLGAIFVPSTGIVDYRTITEKLAELFCAAGGTIEYGKQVARLEQFHDRITAYCGNERYQARYMVACAGLHSDRLVSMLGQKPEFRIIPFRGEYYRLAEQHNQIVNHLIYPIPNPALPFLGVHLTRMIDGSVTVGPNAVLALHREGYRRGQFELSEALRILTYPGTLRLVLKHFRTSMAELKNSLSRRGYLSLVHKYCPQLTLDDLQPYPAGIRAQAVRMDGTPVDDFLFTETARALVVCNAPSPAATSALPIGRHIIERLEKLVEFSRGP